MSATVDRELLAERAAAVSRHLDRVARHLPEDPAELRPDTAATDTVILHLWQAVQVVIDLAVSTCVRLGVGSPPTYADAFRRLADAQVLPRDLADRLARAAGFRNLDLSAPGLPGQPAERKGVRWQPPCRHVSSHWSRRTPRRARRPRRSCCSTCPSSW
jgi:uncharacterized protein YutE (UPF0331/DUF86 family)